MRRPCSRNRKTKMKILKTFKVPGFVAGGLACGIKKKGLHDLTLIVSETPAVAAGVFTQNRVVSPTVTLSRQTLKSAKTIRAVVVNSGNANACTGPKGMKDCKSITVATGKALGTSAKEILIASTGVIGVPLPVEKIERGVPKLAKTLSAQGWDSAAKGILTTDLVTKTECVSYGKIVIGGIAKGSGMIQPNMATMLAFLASNVAIDKRTLQKALKTAVDRTFNRITVDGETSTNDMVLLLANGQAKNPPIKSGTKAYSDFVKALTHVCKTLAFKVVEDGEGATKFVTVQVKGARTSKQGEQVGRSVANSKLVQTALFGRDPNWGRIICAVGYAGVPLQPEKIDITINGMKLVKNGAPVKDLSTAKLKQVMRKKEILVQVNLNTGKAEAEVYGCDISYDYVRINAEYTT